MNSAKPLRWGILSTGRIAGVFATGLRESRLGRAAAVGSRSEASARRFAAEHGIPAAHGSYEALLADPEVDAVYIATPHPEHAAWAVRAAEAGKHVLCEKPAGLNHAEVMVMAEAASAHGVVFMEAFMYRCHPQTQRLADLVRTRAIGELRTLQGTFSFNAGFSPSSRLWSNELAGGGILDVGGYPVSMARLLAGAAAGKPFLDPETVAGAAQLHPETGVDVHASAVLKFPGGVVAQVACGVGVGQDNSLRVYGTEGWIHVESPWVPPNGPGRSTLRLHRPGKPVEEIVVEADRHLYAYEADAFAAAVGAGGRDVPEMSVDDSLGNLATLDQWRAAVGLVYACEKPEAFTHTVSRRPLTRRSDAPMPYGDIPGLAKPVSRLVMGVDNQRWMPHAAAMFDDFFERGGNAFDTARVYGWGAQEKLLGQWIRNRGVRSEVAVIVKGAHTPLCTPEHLSRQLIESLEHLQTDHADLYLLHRDNPEVPVGEFVDVLNEHHRAGRVRVFGGSNWTLERVAAANRYAARKGLRGFGVVSNNFSLARMVEPVWGGCVAASDPESRKWLKKHQMPLLSWSSQARGFFTDRAAPDRREDAELARCWYAEDNWKRRERAVELAREKGTTPIAIAAAYVLHQPFPTFALIGPRTISETVGSFEALKVVLSPKEVAWLNLERDRR